MSENVNGIKLRGKRKRAGSIDSTPFEAKLGVTPEITPAVVEQQTKDLPVPAPVIVPDATPRPSDPSSVPVKIEPDVATETPAEVSRQGNALPDQHQLPPNPLAALGTQMERMFSKVNARLKDLHTRLTVLSDAHSTALQRSSTQPADEAVRATIPAATVPPNDVQPLPMNAPQIGPPPSLMDMRPHPEPSRRRYEGELSVESGTGHFRGRARSGYPSDWAISGDSFNPWQ